MAEALTTQEQLVRVTLRFSPSLLIVLCAFYWEHLTLASSLSFGDLSAHILPRVAVDGGSDVVDETASGPFVRSLPESTDSGVTDSG